MTRRWLVWALAFCTSFVGLSAVIAVVQSHPHVERVRQPGPVVVVALPTLRWDQVGPRQTPELWTLVSHGAVGSIATRSPAGRSCSVQSWLMFSAGTPTDAGPRRCADVTPRTLPGGAAVFDRWKGWRARARSEVDPPDLGATASLLAAVGDCVAAGGPTAALGAANRAGVVAHYTADPAQVDVDVCPVTLVSFANADDVALGNLVARLPPSATIVVTGAADDGTTPTFRPVVVAGPGVPRGVLTSLSTRQPGLLQNADLSSLVLSRLGADAPLIGEGRTPVVRPAVGGGDPADQVRSLVRALDVEGPFVGRFFAVFLGGAALSVLVLASASELVRRRSGSAKADARRTLRGRVQVVAALCTATPAAVLLAGLVPWWRSTHPEWALSLAVLGIASALAAIALLGPWRRKIVGPTAFLLVLTYVVDAQDVVHGSPLQLISLMGFQPVSGGRYYGQGNVQFAVFASSALLIATLVAIGCAAAGRGRGGGVAAVIAIGAATLLIDGAPSWGADGGGALALVPAFGYLALQVAGERLTGRRVALGLGATVALVGGLSLFDFLGPVAYQTHLGGFVTQVVTQHQWQGLSTIWSENWTMLSSTWLTRLVPVLLLAIVAAVRSADRVRFLVRPADGDAALLVCGVRALVVCWMIGFATNDSGTVIPPTGLLVALPALLMLRIAHARAADRRVLESLAVPVTRDFRAQASSTAPQATPTAGPAVTSAAQWYPR